VVFIEEQGVSEADEVDGLDGQAIHLLARDGGPAGRHGAASGAGRDRQDRPGLRPARGAGPGLGAALIRACLDELRKVPGVSEALKLGAQTHALGFYEKLFVAEGDEFIDAGIPHYDMRRPL
jgi:predicted GNAT family N-acyltransferase